MTYKIGDTLQCKKTRMDWVIDEINELGNYILLPEVNHVEVPIEQIELYFDKNFIFYFSLSHMITKKDVEFLNILASKLENIPTIDGLGDNYITKLRSIANNNK
jgi:hypothetical protein